MESKREEERRKEEERIRLEEERQVGIIVFISGNTEPALLLGLLLGEFCEQGPQGLSCSDHSQDLELRTPTSPALSVS